LKAGRRMEMYDGDIEPASLIFLTKYEKRAQNM
jgi:hypothetical protein